MGTILHLNAVGMMAELEENLDSSLKNKPFVIVNSSATSRAVVLEESKIAHREGIRRGMSLSTAQKLVCDITLVPARPSLYNAADIEIEKIACTMTPLVERAGRGHLFIDFYGTQRFLGCAEDATQKLRTEVMNATGLRPVFALSSCKTASKVASRVFRPGGFIALASSDESEVIRQQPSFLLPGVGTVLQSRLRILEIDTIGQIADLQTEDAKAIAPLGPMLVARARCIDDSPVNPEPPEKRHLSDKIVFEPDTCNLEYIKQKLEVLSSKLAFELRKNGTAFKKVVCSITYTDGLHDVGSSCSKFAIRRDDEAANLSFIALEHALKRRVRLRSISLNFSSIEAQGPSLDLFTPYEEKLEHLQIALDKIHKKFGSKAISKSYCFVSEK